jgi:hypothetical protein
VIVKRALAILGVCAILVEIAHLCVRITPDALRLKIRQELPLGSDSTRVVAFLDSLKATHSVFSTTFDSDFPGKVHVIYASVKGFRRGNLLSDGVFMKFKLDDQGRLAESVVRYVFTGP